MFKLQESTLGQLDFEATARAEGKRVLYQRHGALLFAHLGATLSEAALDAALDELISRPLIILRHVTEHERAMAH
jgi:hypothetical protein